MNTAMVKIEMGVLRGPTVEGFQYTFDSQAERSFTADIEWMTLNSFKLDHPDVYIYVLDKRRISEGMSLDIDRKFEIVKKVVSFKLFGFIITVSKP